MSGESDRLASRLEGYGLGEEAKIYVLLLERGPTTALELSKMSGLARTKVYRLVEKLQERQLVRTDPRKHQTLIPAPYQELERQVVVEERRLQLLRTDMSSLFGELAQLVSSQASGSRITYYDDLEGLRQIQENSVSAEGELRIYEKKNMSAVIEHSVAESYRAEFARRRTNTYQLTNLKKVPAVTDVYQHVVFWEVKFIDRAVLPIQFEVIIYNHTVALYNYGEETFGVEIESAPLAVMQKQLFDVVWATALPMRKVGRRGAAVLDS